MADSSTATSSAPEEKTFRSYTNEQGAAYAQHRRGYHPDLFKLVIKQHTSTGGQIDTVIDIGCGPGLAVRALAPQFAHAIGLDPSEGMIAAARSLGGHAATGEPIRFEVSTAEELGSKLSPPVRDASVDLIVAATAAHWFDMARFWKAAARVLKPGGTVALWAMTGAYLDPSTPNHAALDEAMTNFREKELKPYYDPGNLLTRGGYADLPLPWTLPSPVEEFERSTFVRKDWNQDGASDGGQELFMSPFTVDMDTLEKTLSTGSPVERWRAAHPETAGTEQDVVRIVRRQSEKLLHEAGVEEGKELVTAGCGGVLLLVKKKA